MFFYYFCLLIEESGSGSKSGSIPLTNGSGSRRPINMWIRWFRIRIRIWIRHTGKIPIKLKSLAHIQKFLENFNLLLFIHQVFEHKKSILRVAMLLEYFFI
jgi:hypothetical protein